MSNTAMALTQTELALMLADLVCTDRPPLWHEGTAFITNGHTLFVIDGVEQPVQWALWDGKGWANAEWESSLIASPDTLRTFAEPKASLPDFELPTVEPHSSWLKPSEVVKTRCDECRGSGEVTCDYGHEHECEECDGTGKVEGLRIDVEYHSNSGYRDQSIETIAGHIQRRYLWITSRLAENRTLNYYSLPDPQVGLAFSFEGGLGVLMGIKLR